jgi:diguanylate cyclase (GGDEF)-like protein
MPPRLRWYVLAVSAAGLPVAAGAVSAAARSDPGATTSLGIAMFCAFALVAELRPVPLDPAGRRDVSLAFVFIISAQLLFGWEWSVLAGALGIGGAMAVSRHQPMKIAFNASTYAIAAGAAAVTGADLRRLGDGFGYGGLVLMTIVCGAVFVAVNVVLVCIAIGLSSGTSPREVFSDHLHHSGPIFGIMIFVAAQATIFWRLSPALVFLLGGPLVALTLYQRSYVGRRTAEEEAATDSLTALKNRRAFEEEAERSLAAAARGGEVALCLMDIDHFKQVNDRHGHPTGDAVLCTVATVCRGAMREVDHLARLGGDEFALIAPAAGEAGIERIVGALEEAIAGADMPLGLTITATFAWARAPEDAGDTDGLLRCADQRLLARKRERHSPVAA